MATTPFKQSELESAKKEQTKLENILRSSPSAFSSTSPSKSDLAADVNLTAVKNRIQQLQSQKAKEDWYGTSTGKSQVEGGSEKKEGWLSKTLNVLQAPLRAEVGAVKGLLGMGDGKGIIESATKNVLEGHETYGNLLQEGGVPQWISAPLGFALDVAGDPINWATAGTTALVPKVGYGIGKGLAEGGIAGAIKGASTAATSSVGGNVLSVAKFIPGVKSTNLYKSLGEKVFKAGEEYNTLTKIDQLSEAGKGIIPGLDSREGGFTLGKGLEAVLNKIPGGNTIIEKMKYSPADYAEKAKTLDGAFKILDDQGKMSSIPVDLNRVGEMMDNPINKDLLDASFNPKVKFSTHHDQLADEIVRSIDDTKYVAENTTRSSFILADGSTDFEARLAEEALKDSKIKEAVQYFSKLHKDKTGIEVFDKASAWTTENVSKFKIGNVELGKNILTATDVMSNFFKASKVMLNPASHVNSAVSNVFFATMKGFDPLDTFVGDGAASIEKVWSLMKGEQGADFLLKNIFNDMSDFSKYAATNPSEFSRTYGLDISNLGGKYFIDKAVKMGKEMGVATTAADQQELVRQLMSMPDEIRSALESAVKGEKSLEPAVQMAQKSIKSHDVLKSPSALEGTYKNILKGSLNPTTEKYSMLSSEFKEADIKKYYDVKKMVAEKAKEEGAIGYKVLDGLLNKVVGSAQESFERIDQTYKMATALKMTNRGITDVELRKIARTTSGGITEKDIVWSGNVDGQLRHRLTWDKATDIANDTYMNYAAMPAFVRMVRQMPIVGAPFASFTYGLIPKVGEAMVHNPAAFNKVNFLLNEVSGAKTPLEKENLKSPYYSWFNSPGMVKLPFFQNYPTYINLTNMIPYYGMNLFTPSEKKYGDTVPDEIMAMIDKIGLFKTPAGQIVWDYGIQPLITPEGETPQNQFGQPLYPEKATGLEKVGYAARSYAEAYVPSIAAPIIGTASAIATPGLNQYIPSYGGRKFAEGWQDKNQMGILKDQVPTWADVAKTQLINTASLAGISINPMDLTNLTNTVKKSLKK